jgi:hypothetical protein
MANGIPRRCRRESIASALAPGDRCLRQSVAPRSEAGARFVSGSARGSLNESRRCFATASVAARTGAGARVANRLSAVLG